MFFIAMNFLVVDMNPGDYQMSIHVILVTAGVMTLIALVAVAVPWHHRSCCEP